MTKNYARPLSDQSAIEHFLVYCLGVDRTITINDKKVSLEKLAQRIRDAEAAVSQIDPLKSTSSSEVNRFLQHRNSTARKNLHELIIKELITVDRLPDDEKIKLGKGGGKPIGIKPIAGKEAFIIIGLPASGKSTLVASISDKLGAIILDSDFAKRKIPEFSNSLSGAQLVHKESSDIIFGDSGPSLLSACIFKEYNIVIPTIGANEHDLLVRRNSLIKAGYKVHLISTVLPREVSTMRALQRFITTGRYVPLGLIFDGYANDPIMNYYKARLDDPNLNNWASFGSISTHVYPPVIVDHTDASPVLLLNGA